MGTATGNRTPVSGLRARRPNRWTIAAWLALASPARLERATSAIGRRRSRPLSYGELASTAGVEPASSGFGTQCLLHWATSTWCASWDSNPVSSGVRARCPTSQAWRAWWVGEESNPLCRKTAGLQPAAPHGATDPCRGQVALAVGDDVSAVVKERRPDWRSGTKGRLGRCRTPGRRCWRPRRHHWLEPLCAARMTLCVPIC